MRVSPVTGPMGHTQVPWSPGICYWEQLGSAALPVSCDSEKVSSCLSTSSQGVWAIQICWMVVFLASELTLRSLHFSEMGRQVTRVTAGCQGAACPKYPCLLTHRARSYLDASKCDHYMVPTQNSSHEIHESSEPVRPGSLLPLVCERAVPPVAGTAGRHGPGGVSVPVQSIL